MARLREDLVRLAIRGYRFYTGIIMRLAGGRPRAHALARLMREPGFVQVACKQSARHVLPAAMLYDYPFDTNYAHMDRYTLCEAFTGALAAAGPLESSPCFQGQCPVADDVHNKTVVCPSGFWGFRHAVGLPLTVPTAPDPPAVLAIADAPHLAAGVSTAQDLKERAAHQQTLQTLVPRLVMEVGDTREEILGLLGRGKAHVVYFYCHGGLSGDLPYLQVGADEVITPDNLFAVARWDDPRPLVFLNGCHTTALDPEIAFEFIGAFVENAGAAGVIGTEITVFEPLARAFAEECLRQFLSEIPVGEAVRRARLRLLKDGNPLGLVYIPYVMPGLQLARH
jgi:hypothetical protein